MRAILHPLLLLNSLLALKLGRNGDLAVKRAKREGLGGKYPIEDIHAGIDCPTCAGKQKCSHIAEAKMKSSMKNAVDKGVHPVVAQRQ
jgi:hypothetical protein